MGKKSIFTDLPVQNMNFLRAFLHKGNKYQPIAVSESRLQSRSAAAWSQMLAMCRAAAQWLCGLFWSGF